MIKYKIQDFCLQDKFVDHDKIKFNLIDLINLAESDVLEEKQEKWKDVIPMLINRSDWSKANDFKRGWAKYLLPYLRNNFNRMLKEIGFENTSTIDKVWFQHYVKSDIHDWHIHGGNYTGVYYVKFDGVDKTQILNPFDKKLINLEAEEGDIVIFPSTVIHRCPRVTNEKLIVSFNFELGDFTNELQQYMKESLAND